VIRPWDTRTDRSERLESNDDDPELLVFIPFTTDVKIRSISIVGGADGCGPSSMRVYVNREGMDFASCAAPPTQEWQLQENSRGELEYQTRFAKFQGVANLSIHFPSNFGGDRTCIHFIGFKGEATKNDRQAIANVVYEAMPNPQDHKVADQLKMAEIV